MTLITLHHRTVYSYREPVHLHAHRMMLRPRETRDVRLVSNVVRISPDADLTWQRDIHNNAIATATFRRGKSALLQIDAFSKLELTALASPVFDIDVRAKSFPICYSDDDFRDLGVLLDRQYVDPEGILRDWAHAFVRDQPTDTLSLLTQVNQGVSRAISYQARADEGTQSPVQTLTRGRGACRDLAVLFIEAVRTLGFGARVVSGYRYDTEVPTQDDRHVASAGSTHAWAEVYLPGAGWMTFDPTHATLGDRNMIPVACGRNITQVLPVSGSFLGATNAYTGMSVEVNILSDAAASPSPQHVTSD